MKRPTLRSAYWCVIATLARSAARKVLLFSNQKLESELGSINPLIAIDRPLRVLAYESVANSSRVTFNSF